MKLWRKMDGLKDGDAKALLCGRIDVLTAQKRAAADGRQAHIDTSCQKNLEICREPENSDTSDEVPATGVALAMSQTTEVAKYWATHDAEHVASRAEMCLDKHVRQRNKSPSRFVASGKTRPDLPAHARVRPHHLKICATKGTMAARERRNSLVRMP